tara:strand:- start:352 stop:1218 length:867 start_codon:yes stop_codon:yes gene_type:complete
VLKNNILQDRSQIYNLFNKKKKDDQILFKYRLKITDKKRLKKLTRDVIYKCLYKNYKKKFKLHKNYLKKYQEHIFNLPNITPNGAFNCTPEIAKEFNKLHKFYFKLLKNHKILNNLNSATNIVLRLKKGRQDVNLDKRKYATSKIHSDAWNGQVCDAICMTMVDGDVRNNSVEYYCPINPSKNILKKINNFDDGSKLYQKLKPLGIAQEGVCNIFDQICLHRTFQRKSSPRVSIDFGISFKRKKNIKDHYIKNSNRYKYYNLSEWKKLNYLNIKKFKFSLLDLERKYK